MTKALENHTVSVLDAEFRSDGRHTSLHRIHESGALRLRLPRGPACESVIVNTGGGIVAGDQMNIDLRLAAQCAVTLTSVAAEKIYRSPGLSAQIATRIHQADASRLDWLPQETILFDGARLERRFSADLAATATLVAAEMSVFGRLAMDEQTTSGRLRDRWRVRRAGCLVFADETMLDGPIGAVLDRKAVAGGGRASTLLVAIGPDVEAWLDAVRAAFVPFQSAEAETHVEAGASTRDGLLIARLVGRGPARVRAALVATLSAMRSSPLPRVWA